VDATSRRVPARAPGRGATHTQAGDLNGLGLLDSAPDEAFDRLTHLLNRLLGVPASQLTVVEQGKCFVLGHSGHGGDWAYPTQAALNPAFSGLVMAGREPLAVSDATLDERVSSDRSIAELGAVALAGVPVLLGQVCVGSLCALDMVPRAWSEEDMAALSDVAASVTDQLALRKARLDRDRALASEAHIRIAFDSAAVGMLLVNQSPESSGRIERVNASLCQMLGRSRESLVGTHVDDITYPADRRMSHAAVDGLMRGERAEVRHLEKRYVHADGHAIWGALTCSAVMAPDGGAPPFVISLVEDITEQKEAELDLPAIANVLRRILSGEDSREAIVQAALDIAGASSAYLLEPEGEDRLVVTASAAVNMNGLEVPLDTKPSATAQTYLTGEPLFLADPAESPQVSPKLLALSGARSIMLQPIFSYGKVIGVLCVCWAERVSDGSARGARAVALLTDETSVALAHRDALQRLAAQATTDGLTGLPNRRAWDERLARDLASARRLQRPITLALLDMDRFKLFNDTRGHAAGDELLREFANRARTLLREGDTFARWGGEEFAVLLPDCPSDSFAHSILDRIRGAVPQEQTCSVGYATWDAMESADALVERADRALYRAKALGRNQAVAADPSPLSAAGADQEPDGEKREDGASSVRAKPAGAPWRPHADPADAAFRSRA